MQTEWGTEMYITGQWYYFLFNNKQQLENLYCLLYFVLQRKRKIMLKLGLVFPSVWNDDFSCPHSVAYIN